MAAMGGAGADVEKGDGVGDADAGIRLVLAFIVYFLTSRLLKTEFYKNYLALMCIPPFLVIAYP